MFTNLRKKLSYLGYDYSVRGVTKLPPQQVDSQGQFILLSMMCKRDLYQYLVALHSLLRFVRPKRIILLNDGTLGPKEEAIILRFCPDITFHKIEEFREGGLPSGGCWERITAVAHYSKEDYVVQLDADTLFTRDPIEMKTAINSGHSFALPTNSGKEVVSAREAIQYAKDHQSPEGDHIQLELEANLNIMGDIDTLKYIRACAGFGGYAPGTVTMEKLHKISECYQAVFKDRWFDWGTEQFTSNYVLANSDQLTVLPIEKYNSVNAYDDELSFIHFIGSHRFVDKLYHQLSRQVIQQVKTKGSSYA